MFSQFPVSALALLCMSTPYPLIATISQRRLCDFSGIWTTAVFPLLLYSDLEIFDVANWADI